ncbi:phospholipase [Streptomyces sp. TR06-5]|uniref:phospholipase n=1 Tax=unclassified Streptomyces TaxID=2593676 RepID=UPI0039A390FA
MHRRSIVGMSVATSAAAVVALAAPANAATKLDLMYSWSQTSASSEAAFHSARSHYWDYSSYGFDWSTDKCSSSPDNPFGFPFENACIRHDFNYRNFKDEGLFDPNKDRIDSAFYEDLKRVCDQYSGATGSSCNATAWTYYQAVSIFGISAADAPAYAEKVDKYRASEKAAADR